jgi:hypothetical protein
MTFYKRYYIREFSNGTICCFEQEPLENTLILHVEGRIFGVLRLRAIDSC